MKPTIKSHDLTVYCGDALTVLGEMEDGCVQCVVTSPPYDNLRTYGQQDKAEWDFEGIAKELYRVLCEGGICCWNVGDSVNDGSETLTSFKQALFFKEQVGFRVHDTMIWKKSNFSNPESVRYHQLFEYVFILSKGKPRCFNPIKDKPNATAGRIGCLGENTYAKRDGSRSTRETYVTTEFGMRGNVWDGSISRSGRAPSPAPRLSLNLQMDRESYRLGLTTTKSDLAPATSASSPDAAIPHRIPPVHASDRITEAECPEWAGLIYAHAWEGHRRPYACFLSPIRKAPRLHRNAAEHLKAHAQSVCYYRMNNLYMKRQLDFEPDVKMVDQSIADESPVS